MVCAYIEASAEVARKGRAGVCCSRSRTLNQRSSRLEACLSSNSLSDVSCLPQNRIGQRMLGARTGRASSIRGQQSDSRVRQRNGRRVLAGLSMFQNKTFQRYYVQKRYAL